MTPLGDFIALPTDPNTPHPRAHRIPDCPLQWEYGDLVDRKLLKIPAVNDTVLYQIPYPAREFIRTEPFADPVTPTIVPGTRLHQMAAVTGLLMAGPTMSWVF